MFTQLIYWTLLLRENRSLSENLPKLEFVTCFYQQTVKVGSIGLKPVLCHCHKIKFKFLNLNLLHFTHYSKQFWWTVDMSHLITFPFTWDWPKIFNENDILSPLINGAFVFLSTSVADGVKLEWKFFIFKIPQNH